MSSAILPSITINFVVPFVLTPVTWLRKQQVFAMSDLPGSIIKVSPRDEPALLPAVDHVYYNQSVYNSGIMHFTSPTYM